MGLKEKLQADLTDAIRARDEVKSGTVRMLLAAITNEEVAGKAAKVLTDAEIITVLSREAKKRREAVEAYTNAKRDDLANKEKTEAAVIALYLPEQLSEEAIKKMITAEAASRGFAAASLRYFNVAGALKSKRGWLAERHNPETHLIPNVLRSTKENPVKIFGTDWPTADGTCVRDYVHVVDLIDAHIKALETLTAGVHDALWFTGCARCVQQKQQLFRIHWFGNAHWVGFGHDVVIPMIATIGHRNLVVAPFNHHNVLNAW